MLMVVRRKLPRGKRESRHVVDRDLLDDNSRDRERECKYRVQGYRVSEITNETRKFLSERNAKKIRKRNRNVLFLMRFRVN